jgi:photosystem II stability/assembly factor-like uncharacterized protein
MSQIIDVSPVAVTDQPDINRSVNGRMLSIACSPDGQVLFAGSYSNLWVSYDSGQTWDQLTWPQPGPDQFDVPGSLGGWCAVDIAVALGWRVEKHPRFAVDLNNDGCADIVGFGDDGVWTAIGKGDGTFQDPQFVLENFGVNQGWGVEHPRLLAVMTKSGFTDIVGFGDSGVYIAFGNGDGTFTLAGQPYPVPVIPDFGYQSGWRVEKHVRVLGDVNGDGCADIVAFGDAGVYVVLSNGDQTFNYQPDPLPVIPDFGYDAGGWRVDKHPRFLADLTGHRQASIVGFGDTGVYVALNKDDGSGGFNYQPDPLPVIPDLGYDSGWRVAKHPRFLADLTGHGQASIVGFGAAGVYVAVNKDDGSGSLNYQPVPVISNFGYDAGGWRVDKHPRLLGDLTGHGQASIVGFGEAGVWTALANGLGGFPVSNFVLSSFGYGMIVLALTSNDRVAGSRGIWRSTDGGATWQQVFQFPDGEVDIGQLQWALDSDHLVYAAGGSALAISKNAGATFEPSFPWGNGQALNVNHVAVWQNSPADPVPAVIYALGDIRAADGPRGIMFLSFDGGDTWMQDQAALPLHVGRGVGSTGNSNTPDVLVISPRFPLEVYVAQDGSSGPPALFRGDYSQFPFGDQTSSWEQVPLPAMQGQDSGNVFLATTQRGRGDLLFYGPQQLHSAGSAAYVGPLYPASGGDWRALGDVHVDLHGILLSPNFEAAIQDGNYKPKAGTVWIMSDGGIYRSTDGGQTFQTAENVRTLACVNVAGVATSELGPALSLNGGDNAGFCSMDGGATWSYEEYNGGDNDGAFADPLRPHAMMVCTPRWDSAGNWAGSQRHGQTVAVYQTDPGKLPDARLGEHDRRAVTGPPTLPDSVKNPWDIWNAQNPSPNSYVSRGTRPIVLGLPGESAPAQGDYVFILNPTLDQPQVVRTQNIFDIVHRDEWITTARGPGQGASVFLQGPPLQGPNVGVLQTAGGHAATVFYAGGCGLGGNGTLWSWADGMADWNPIVPALAGNGSVGANFALRFFVSPYQPNVIYIVDIDPLNQNNNHVKRSDDGGVTWSVDTSLETQLTWNHQLVISPDDDSSGVGDRFDSVLTDTQFDPNNAMVRFAVGEGGVFQTIDGVTWTRLLHTAALTGRPANCYYDWISPSSPSLYVAFAGRSLVKIADLLLTQIF